MTSLDKVKTGTTLVGIKCKDCIVLAADMRTTAGHMKVSDKSDKINEIAPNIIMAQAGSVSTNQLFIKHLRSELKLKDIKTGRMPLVKEAANLLINWIYRQVRSVTSMDDISAFIMAGYDRHGIHLYNLNFDGTLREIDTYTSTGSGMVFVYGLLDNRFKEDMTQEDGVKLVTEAVDVAIHRDIATGDGINIFVIKKDGIEKVESKRIQTHL